MCDMASAGKHVWCGVLVGLAIAAIAMVAYCVVLALPLDPGQDSQSRSDNTERVGNVVLFGVVIYCLAGGPTAAAFGGAFGVITYLARHRRPPTRVLSRDGLVRRI